MDAKLIMAGGVGDRLRCAAYLKNGDMDFFYWSLNNMQSGNSVVGYVGRIKH